MKKMIMLLLTFLLSLNCGALEIDEKLTVRLLSVSKSLKTILVNRGLEDGLVVGDHAKFFLTTGVVGRGVVIKASPGRSIWSLYRLIVPDKVTVDKIMNLKISSPVKVTEDPTKALYEQTSKNRQEVMASRSDLSKSDKSDIAALTEGANSPVVYNSGSLLADSWEVYGMVNLNSMSGTWTQGEESSTAQSGGSDMTFGIEKYFPTAVSAFKNVSINGFIAKSDSSSGGTNQTQTSFFGYGVGANYHFHNSPHSYGKLIGFFGANFGSGATSITTTLQVGSESETDAGTTSFYSFGVGGKYYIMKGIAAQVVFDYYQSSSTFVYEDSSENLVLALGGMRLRAGVSYCF